MVFDLKEYEGNPNVRPIPERCVLSLKDLGPRHRDDAPAENGRCVGMVVTSDDAALLDDIIMKEAQLHPDYWIKFSLVSSRTNENCGHGSPIINPRMGVKQFAAYAYETPNQSEMHQNTALRAVLRSLGAKQGFKPQNIEVEYMAIYENMYGNLTFMDLDRE